MKLSPRSGIKTIGEVHAAVQEELSGDGDAVLDFSDLTRLDLSVAQVVLAAAREASKRKIKLRLKGVSDDIRHQLYLCGLKV